MGSGERAGGAGEGAGCANGVVGGEGEGEERDEGEEEDPFADGYERTVGAGVTVVEKNVDCDILDGPRLDADQEVAEHCVCLYLYLFLCLCLCVSVCNM